MFDSIYHRSSYGTKGTFKSESGCKDQESTQSSTTLDPGYQWESDKLTVRHPKTRAKRSVLSQAHINSRAQRHSKHKTEKT